jgi:cytochrome P450
MTERRLLPHEWRHWVLGIAGPHCHRSDMTFGQGPRTCSCSALPARIQLATVLRALFARGMRLV